MNDFWSWFSESLSFSGLWFVDHFLYFWTTTEYWMLVWILCTPKTLLLNLSLKDLNRNHTVKLISMLLPLLQWPFSQWQCSFHLKAALSLVERLISALRPVRQEPSNKLSFFNSRVHVWRASWLLSGNNDIMVMSVGMVETPRGKFVGNGPICIFRCCVHSIWICKLDHYENANCYRIICVYKCCVISICAHCSVMKMQVIMESFSYTDAVFPTFKLANCFITKVHIVNLWCNLHI